jgi:hypothetical protein
MSTQCILVDTLTRQGRSLGQVSLSQLTLDRRTCVPTLNQALTFVNKIPTRHMRRAEPKRVVETLDFFDDGPTIRQVDLILDGGKTVAAYDTV